VEVEVVVVLRLPIVEEVMIEVLEVDVLVVEVLLDTTAATSYMLRRLGPPQYSVALPLQSILHIVTSGVAPPTRLEPALIEFPQ